MLTWLTSMTLSAQVMGVPLATVLVEPVTPVPTVPAVASAASWTVQPSTRDQLQAPQWKNSVEVQQPDGVTARSAIVIDEMTGRRLWQKNPDLVTPIASITKLMTVLVWKQHQPADGLDAIHRITPADDTPGGKELDLPYDTEVSADQLLHLALIASYNDAALALAHTTDVSDDEFVQEMNATAQALGLSHMHFTDPTGLGVDNTATAADIAQLAAAVFSDDSLASITRQSDYSTSVSSGTVTTTTTDLLLFDPSLDIEAGKTGYIDEAGYCFVTRVRVPDTDRAVWIVVLGSTTDEQRFEDVKTIFQWTIDHYQWPS